MLNDYTNYLEAVKAANLSVDIARNKLKDEEKKLSSILCQFRAYNKKKLKEAEKATILIPAGHSSNGSWFIKGTNISLSVEQYTGEITLWSYDRKNYFCLPLQRIKTGTTYNGFSVWNDVLTDDEKEAIDSLIAFISA